MPSFIDHLDTEILALEHKLRELRRIRALYGDDPVLSAAPDLAENPILRKVGTRKKSPETERAIEEAAAFLIEEGERNQSLTGDMIPVPIRRIFHHVRDVRGCHIGGSDPINNFSAMMSRSGKFISHGRAGWTLGPSSPNVYRSGGDTDNDANKPESESPSGLPSPDAMKANGAMHVSY